jgi:RND superfamily putative drug exporter
VLLIGLGAAMGTVGSNFSDASRLPKSDSSTAYDLLAKAGNDAASAKTGVIVWHTSDQDAVSGSTRSTVGAMLQQVAAVDGVRTVLSPFVPSGSAQVSKDGHTAYATVVFESTAHANEAKTLAQHASTTRTPVQVGGAAFTNNKPSEVSELIGVIAALVVLVLVFRSLWAAALPIITGVAGVAVSSVAVMLLSNVLTLSSIVISMGALIGLGVGIDYALFIVNRQRQALLAGTDPATAVETAMNTSGRAVLFAGATVIIALLGMLVLGVGFLSGMAIAAALTVALTVAAATTLLPALLGKVGYRVLRKRDRRFASTAAYPEVFTAPSLKANTNGSWARWSQVVERRPAAIGMLAVGVLIAIAAPALALRLGSADASSDPAGSATRSYYTTMSAAFGDGFQSQLLLVAETPDAPARTAWTHLVRQLPSLSGVASVAVPVRVTGDTLSMVTLTPTSTGQANATSDLVHGLRSDVITRAEAGTRLRVHVGGTTATSIDFANALTSKLPLFLVIIAGLGFLLLTLAFRSLLVPAIGALGNLLTIAVALGATVVLFQWGYGPSLFGIGGSGPVEYIVAMLIVGVMFGLSMDYHVFLVSRMREEWIRTGDNRRSVSAGVSDTGRVIATAATIMGCVFASFGFAGMRTASEFGVGLAVAVLLDAFLMRMTIIPAVMHKIGDRNWALPGWLDRALPHVSVEGPEDTANQAPANLRRSPVSVA